MRSRTYRLSRDGKTLLMSVPLFVSYSEAYQSGLEMFPRLLKKARKPAPVDGDEVWLFGEKKTVDGFGLASEEEREATYKRLLLPYAKAKTEEYRLFMGIKTDYKVIVRTMKSRFGVNSAKTKRISYATSLVHYAPATIDSVIVHELAHDKERNHGEKFYAIVYRYCPDYKKYRRKMIKGDYQ